MGREQSAGWRNRRPVVLTDPWVNAVCSWFRGLEQTSRPDNHFEWCEHLWRTQVHLSKVNYIGGGGGGPVRPREIRQPSKLCSTCSSVLLPDPFLTQTSWTTSSDQLNEASFREPSPRQTQLLQNQPTSRWCRLTYVWPAGMVPLSIQLWNIPAIQMLERVNERMDPALPVFNPISFLSLMSWLIRHSIKYDSSKQGCALLQEAERRLLTWNIKTVNLTSAVVIWTMVAQTLCPHVKLWSKVKWIFMNHLFLVRTKEMN